MDFVDSTLLALADDGTRAGVFDPAALEQLLAAAYDVDAIGPIQGTLTPVFDKLELGCPAPPVAVAEGATQSPAARIEVRARIVGLPDEGALRVDAVWRGSILARYAQGNDRVVDVSMTWPDPNAVVAARGVAQVAFADPEPVSTVRRSLPVAVALMIRPAPISLARLLWESKTLRERLTEAGLGLPEDASLRRRRSLVIAWIVPASVFADTAWPGADAVDRRTKAGAWLAREGIGLVTR